MTVSLTEVYVLPPFFAQVLYDTEHLQCKSGTPSTTEGSQLPPRGWRLLRRSSASETSIGSLPSGE